ncbi:MAG TPA: hypothetical protein VJM51_02200 [Dehalococcoidia bacterium]|nr:hypothetical protein [Dehalococcoidia bacterium]
MTLRKVSVALLTAILLATLVPSPALANPPEGAITENPRKTIVRDPLAPTGADPDALGWVTFACESVEGFQYSISVKGLVPNATYTVSAVAQPLAFVPVPPFFLPTSDFPASYALGTVHTNGKGEGKLDNGLILLPATHPFLPFGLYEWAVEVKDSSATTVLVPGPDLFFGGTDYNGFQVFTKWP